MTTKGDKQTFRNEDLVLKVTTNIDPKVWDETKYEAFLDELCGTREYQKEAICTALRYLLGGKYDNLRELAQECSTIEKKIMVCLEDAPRISEDGIHILPWKHFVKWLWECRG